MEGPPYSEDKVLFTVTAFGLVIASVFVLSVLGLWVLAIVEGDNRPSAATTVHIFRPPLQAKPERQPEPLARLRPVRFHHPRDTATFMAKYLDDGPAFDDVVYGVATPSEITLHGDLYGSRFDLSLYKVGRQTVLVKNCMMGSCYTDWAGALLDHHPEGSARSVLHERVRAGILRLG